MALKHIVAVEIGNESETIRINSKADLKANRGVVRPYLRGLVQGLAPNFVLGTNAGAGNNYIIHVRQRPASEMGGAFDNIPGPAPFVIFCSSRTVVEAAQVRFANPGTQAIVGVVSSPSATLTNATNVCGIKAKRSDSAGDCFNRFLMAFPALRTLHILHKPGYQPSVDALALVTAAVANHNTAVPGAIVTPNTVDGDNVAAIIDKIDGLTAGPTVGIQVLPVDSFLGHAKRIIKKAQGDKNIPTFWPVPDLVKQGEGSAFGAYGVSQRRCGALMAERMSRIFNNAAGNDQVPGGARWVDVASSELTFLTSADAALDLNIELAVPEQV